MGPSCQGLVPDLSPGVGRGCNDSYARLMVDGRLDHQKAVRALKPRLGVDVKVCEKKIKSLLRDGI